MGKVLSTVTKPFRNFAVEARAHKVISQDKPKPAPWHPSVERQIEQMKQDVPGLPDLVEQKDQSLNEMLKKVYVTSEDITPARKPVHEDDITRQLPQRRSYVEEPEYGFQEPERVPMGKITIRQAMLLLSAYQTNQDANDVESLALKFNLELERTRNIVKYFRTFELYMPENAKGAGLSSKDVTKLISSTSSSESGANNKTS